MLLQDGQKGIELGGYYTPDGDLIIFLNQKGLCIFRERVKLIPGDDGEILEALYRLRARLRRESFRQRG